jgi:hypothetical protein
MLGFDAVSVVNFELLCSGLSFSFSDSSPLLQLIVQEKCKVDIGCCVYNSPYHTFSSVCVGGTFDR